MGLNPFNANEIYKSIYLAVAGLLPFSVNFAVAQTPFYQGKTITMMDFHAIMEIPKGVKHPRFSQLPEIESFARTETDKQVLVAWRVFRLAGSPYLLPPGTPEEPNPLMPEELAGAIKGIPRNAEVADLIKKLSGAGPLPRR
jgi:hypothetical protein